MTAVTDSEFANVACLTPPGVGAIATLAVVGPRSWEIVRQLFHGSSPLPAAPVRGRVWHGWLGEQLRDEVTISADLDQQEGWIEIHCHGGTEVVRALLEQFQATGMRAVSWQDLPPGRGKSPLQSHAELALCDALTLRTADILLWQVHGALDRALLEIRAALDCEGLVPCIAIARAFASTGRHRSASNQPLANRHCRRTKRRQKQPDECPGGLSTLDRCAHSRHYP